MSTLFGRLDGSDYGRGCFAHITLDTSAGLGMCVRASDGAMLGAVSPTADLVIIGFSFKKAESIATIKCFNDSSFIYAFGDNIDSSLFGVTMVGSLQASNTMVSSVMAFYEKNRISKQTKAPCTFTYGGNYPLQGYLISVDSNTTDNKYRLQNISMSFIMV